ncbi:MAG: ArnT family glycosyltransferase [Chitinophagales bacterium]
MTLKRVLDYKERTLLLIGISTLIRLLVGSVLELGSAEVYYWAYSLHLQWNYFDHPPMVAWLIRLTTANLLLHQELFVRLGAIISSAICTWLIFKIGTAIDNLQTGWFAALLYTSSLYSSIIAGTFILPDSPQMVFWLAGILLLIKISHAAVYDQKSTWLWCLFGILSGLCIMSKVHGIFLWFGVILYALLVKRGWLKYRGIYLSAVITLIIISPIIIWNLQNNFISYKFHSSRVTLMGAGIHIKGFIREFIAVILITNPVNFFLTCSSLVWAFRKKIPADKRDIQLLLFCSLPLIVILLFISLFRDTLPHWPGPAYSCLLILPAMKLTSAMKWERSLFPNSIKWALTFMLLMIISVILITNYYPGTISEQKDGLNIGKGDLTLDMYGWEEAGQKFDSVYRSDVAKKIMPYGAPIIVTNWFPAAHIDYYIATRTRQETLGMGSILNLHQYYWMNEYKKQLKEGDNAYFIVSSNLFNYKTFDMVMDNFMRYEMPLVIPELRGGIICKQLYVFRLIGYRIRP